MNINSITFILTILATIGGVIVVFYRTREELKDKINVAEKDLKDKVIVVEKELKSKIHELELKIKDLEYKDQLQQQLIDTIPNIYGVVNRLLEQKGGEYGNK